MTLKCVKALVASLALFAPLSAQAFGPLDAPAPSAYPNDPARYYPDRALRNNVGGRVTIRCTIGAAPPVGAAWRLDDCAVVKESPSDFGFGAATVAIARNVRIDPAAAHGLRLGQVITRTVVWQVPPDPAPRPAPGR